ncbi:MAG: OmpH family outer membrane protein [Candidatus Binatia bacterium]|nr:OmpH family outer membrane protein [Candidatus Binatia bacterium]
MRPTRIYWLILLLLLLAPPLRAADVKIGFVDLQRALNESNRGKKAKEEFKTEVEKLQAQLKKKKDQLDNLKEQLEKKGAVMKEEERANLEEEYRKKLRDFERDYKDSQADLQRKDAELTGAILKELQEVIQEFGEREGYTMIFEAGSSAVLFGAKGADLTDQILDEYNRKKR